MQTIIPSPKRYEALYGSSGVVREYLNQIEERITQAFPLENIDILCVSLLIAHPDELAQGLFLEYEKFEWKSGFVAVGVNGNFERYHLGDDLEKILELSEMLQAAFTRISKKKKAKFDGALANAIVVHTTRSFEERFGKKEEMRD